MIWLSGCDAPVARATDGVGLMLTPGAGTAGAVPLYEHYAIDNGVFGTWSRGQTFDAGAWWFWLWSQPYDPARCLFAVAPDVVGDMEATWASSDPWLELIRWGQPDRPFPVAVVAQDGADGFAPLWDETERWDVLFIGGSDDFKLSQAALDCCDEALLAGKWVHVGRVNSAKRLLRFNGRAHSSDGTFLAYGPDANAAAVRSWMRRLDEPEMFPRWHPISQAEDEAMCAALERTTAVVIDQHGRAKSLCAHLLTRHAPRPVPRGGRRARRRRGRGPEAVEAVRPPDLTRAVDALPEHLRGES